jgi:predicted Holliday junction resolvase-like endonuclease
VNELVLGVALVIAVFIIVSQAIRNASYRATHLYDEAAVKRLRAEAVQGSRLTKGGQVADQLAPLLPEFYERFNPKDARFLGGGPIDFVIFEGLDEGDVRQVLFLDVKTGNAELNSRQRQVKRAVKTGRVDFDVLKLPRVSSDSEHGC